jgi:hypothetical protein
VTSCALAASSSRRTPCFRQQLIVASRKVKRPTFRPLERGLLALLARLVPRWRDALLVVKPETVLRWHRAGFRLFWRHTSKTDARREPKLAPDLVALIRQMAANNRTRGSERTRGELLKLGIHVSKRTIQKYRRGIRTRVPHGGQRWRTFLRNHTVWACDFLQTYDIWFRPIFAFFIVDINSKRVVHVGATYNPSQQWTAPSPCCRLHSVQTNMGPSSATPRRSGRGLSSSSVTETTSTEPSSIGWRKERACGSSRQRYGHR